MTSPLADKVATDRFAEPSLAVVEVTMFGPVKPVGPGFPRAATMFHASLKYHLYIKLAVSSNFGV